MEVNTNIWGLPETWVTPSASDIQSGSVAEIKKATDSQDTYKENYDNGHIPLNDIDFSPAFYGIGKDCIFCNPYYIAPYADGGDLTKPKIDVRPVLDQKKDRPLMFITNNQSSSNIQYSNRFAPDLSSVTSNATSNSRMVLDFNYQKVFIIPQIYYAADNFHNSVTNTYRWGLYEYFANYVEASNINHILGLGYRVYVGDADSRTLANAGIKAYTIFDDVKGYEGTYDNVPFYAQYGMKTPAILGHAVDSNRYCQLCKYNDTRTTRNATVGTADTGFRFKYCKANNTAVAWYYYEPDNPLWKVQIEEIASGNTYWNPIPYIQVTTANKDEVYRYLLKQIAYIGLPFLYGDTVENYNYGLGSEHYALPVFDENGVTTGEFKTGDQARLLPNSLWTDSRNSGYVPNKVSDDDSGDLYNRGNKRFYWNSLNVHLLPAANYDQFIQKLNALNMTDPDNEKWQLQFKGLNPSDYIVGAYVSFVKPPKTTASTIMLGPVDIEQTEYTYNESDSNAGYFSFGTKPINNKYFDFRDYAPYTMIEVYLPLCGTVEVDTAYFMGASMKIDYYYDIFTMSCVACIYRIKEGQEMLYKTVNGTIGAQIPMLSANMGAYQNQIRSIENALKQNELKLMTSTAALAAGAIAAPITSGASLIAAGTAALSGAAGLAQGIAKQNELEYQIEHLQPSISVTGAADPQTDLCTGQLMPKIIIKRAKMLDTYNQSDYAKTIGHACCINDTLGYIEGNTGNIRHGLVVCSSVDTTGISQNIGDNTYISPTADEINMIKQALSSGVIL